MKIKRPLTRKELFDVARPLRKELEKLRHVKDKRGRLGPMWADRDLAGLCMYGAIMVWKQLKKLGRKPSLVAGCGHFFTYCDGYLIDITASQFGMKNIEVRRYNPDDPSYRYGDDFWHCDLMADDIEVVGREFANTLTRVRKTYAKQNCKNHK